MSLDLEIRKIKDPCDKCGRGKEELLFETNLRGGYFRQFINDDVISYGDNEYGKDVKITIEQLKKIIRYLDGLCYDKSSLCSGLLDDGDIYINMSW